MNQWQEAEQHFERAIEFIAQRAWAQALDEMRQATAVNPYNAGWFVHLGLILDEMSRCDEAAEAYQRGADLEPQNISIQERLAAALARSGRLRQALAILRRLNEADPSHEPAYCQRILVHADLNEHELAEEAFYTARLYKDHCPRCYDHMGRSLQARGLHDKAIFCFQKCLDLDPAWPDALRRMGQSYWAKCDREQARQSFLADLRHNPGRWQTLLDLGDVLLELGRVQEAGEKYRRCIEQSPTQAAGYWHYGRWLVRCHKIDQADRAFAEALRLDPTCIGIHLEMARLSLRRGDRPTAMQHLRLEHLLGPGEEPILLALANLWMDCGEDQTAIACLERLTALAPGSREAWLNLGVAQCRQRLYRQGIASCSKALELPTAAPSNRTTAMILYNLAAAHERLRQYSTALDWAKKALALEPRDTACRALELRLRVLKRAASACAFVRRLFKRR